MARYRLAVVGISVCLVLILGCRESEQTQEPNQSAVAAPEKPPAPPEEAAAIEEPSAEEAADVEVLTRGPIHEAFAQPLTLEEGAPLTITRRPPELVEEIPPDEKPEGDQVVWIPGYWAWDDDRSDFIWVSGCWRAVPPERSWVPGYWAQVRAGYQWISGFWTTADSEQVEYLPMPPDTLEVGPPYVPAAADTIWVPGCWVWHQARYAWRPGFWQRGRANWVWVPAHYLRTPYGWIYLEGYWDYVLERRGLVFLPVYCRPRPGLVHFRYSPRITLDLQLLFGELFCSPPRHHYYFGDYYAPDYVRRGFHPWFEVRGRHDWYDPIFAHQEWSHRDDPRWERNLRTAYDHRRDDEAARPPRTYEALKTQLSRLPEKERRQEEVGRPLQQVVAEKAAPIKFEKLTTKRRQETATRGRELQAFEEQRSRWETMPGTGPVRERTVTQPSGEPTPTSPQERRVTPPARLQPAPAVGPEEPSPTPRTRPQPPSTVTPEERRVTPPTPRRPVPAVTPEEPSVTPPTRPQPPSTGTPEERRATRPTPPRPAPAVTPEEPAAEEEVQPRKVTIPRSPITALKPSKDKRLTPPPKPQAPQPDTTVRPKPRRAVPPPESTEAPAPSPRADEGGRAPVRRTGEQGTTPGEGEGVSPR